VYETTATFLRGVLVMPWVGAVFFFLQRNAQRLYVCMAGDLSQRLFTLFIGLNVHLCHMKIYCCTLTLPREALYTDPEDIFLLCFVKYSQRRKIGGMKIVTGRNSSVAIVSRLQTGQPWNRGLVLGRSNKFCSLQRPNRHWESLSLFSRG
jgi:hypothetical protein